MEWFRKVLDWFAKIRDGGKKQKGQADNYNDFSVSVVVAAILLAV